MKNGHYDYDTRSRYYTRNVAVRYQTTIEFQGEFNTSERNDNVLNPNGGVVIRHNLSSTSGRRMWALVRWAEYELEAKLKESN